MRAARTAWIALILVAVAAVVPAQDRADIVLLRNGTTVEGLLLEQSPGNYLLLTTEDGTLAYVSSADLLGVEHGAGELLSDQYEDMSDLPRRRSRRRSGQACCARTGRRR